MNTIFVWHGEFCVRLACTRDAPPKGEVVLALLHARPVLARTKTLWYPLHEALRRRAPLRVVRRLVECHP